MIRGVTIVLCALTGLAAADDDPVARLAPAWTEQLDTNTLAIDRGQVIAAAGGQYGGLHVFDLADGYGGPAGQTGADAFAVAAADGRVIVGARHQGMVTAWPRSGPDTQPAALWSFDSPSEELEAFAIDDARAFALLLDSSRLRRRRLIALSLITGKQLWDLELPPNAAPQLLDTSGPGGVIAGRLEITDPERSDEPATFAIGFDRVTGARVWSFQGPSSAAMAANHRVLLLARDGSVTFVDRVTGHALATDLPASFTPQIAATDEIAIVAGATADGGAIVALDLATRRARLIDTSPVMSDTPIAIGNAVAYVQLRSGAIRAIDRFTGAHRWEWSFGERAQLTAHGDRLLVVAAGALSVFAPGRAPPIQEATIHGKAAIECREMGPLDIVVGDTPVRTAADGTYAVKVRGRGTIGIRFAERELSPGISVALLGRTRYRAPLLGGSECGGD